MFINKDGRKPAHGPQRSSQIVRNGIRERVQLLVRRFKLGAAFTNATFQLRVFQSQPADLQCTRQHGKDRRQFERFQNVVRRASLHRFDRSRDRPFAGHQNADEVRVNRERRSQHAIPLMPGIFKSISTRSNCWVR